MSLIAVGTDAPDWTLQDQDKTEHRLSDYRGQPVVMLFYPKDFSPVCSNEMACMVDNMARFNDLGVQVFGVSVDHTHAHKAFAVKMGIEYPLLADFHPKGEMSHSYGFYRDDLGVTIRGYVVIAADGKVAAAKDVGWTTIPDVEEIAAVVEQSKR